MERMFYEASDFNQPLNGWNVAEVTNMISMFWLASRFDQDLGWCLKGSVYVNNMFLTTKCAPASPYTPSATPVCGVTKAPGCQL